MHSDEYVKNYIKTHRNAHNMDNILNHLHNHGVTTEQIHRVLKDVDKTHQVQQNTLTPYEYILMALFALYAGLTLIATNMYVITVFFFFTLLAVLFAYVGSRRDPEIALIAVTVVGLVMFFSHPVEAVLLAVLNITITIVLHFARRPEKVKKISGN